MQSVTVTLLSGYGVRGWEEKNPYRILEKFTWKTKN